MPAEVTDYSQSGEQTAILKVFESKVQPLRFLDIGAWHSKLFSNTRALYERGWSGVLVEPSPGPLRGLVEEFGKDERVTIIGAAIGTEHHLVKFHITDDAVSTSEEVNAELWKERGGFFGSLWVPMITLPELVHQFGGFHFVSIDTEGTSAAIFRELMAMEMFPACVCVEKDNNLDEMCSVAIARGYKLMAITTENAVFSL